VIQSVAVIANYAVAIFLTAGAAGLSAQTSANRQVHVTVTDPQGRIVTGLDPSHFAVVENGVHRAITGFSGDSYPIAVALVSSEPLTNPGPPRLGDVLIQTRSLSDAVRQLDASGLARKVIVAASVAEADSIPAGVEFIQTNSADVQKTIVRLQNQYRLEFNSESSSAAIEVVVAKPVGMPPLTPSWN
jgi:hypothetical protein